MIILTDADMAVANMSTDLNKELKKCPVVFVFSDLFWKLAKDSRHNCYVIQTQGWLDASGSWIWKSMKIELW